MTGLFCFLCWTCCLPSFCILMPSFSKWKQYFCTSEKRDCLQCGYRSTGHFLHTNYTCTLFRPLLSYNNVHLSCVPFLALTQTRLLLLFFDRMMPLWVQFLKESQIISLHRQHTKCGWELLRVCPCFLFFSAERAHLLLFSLHFGYV